MFAKLFLHFIGFTDPIWRHSEANLPAKPSLHIVLVINLFTAHFYEQYAVIDFEYVCIDKAAVILKPDEFPMKISALGMLIVYHLLSFANFIDFSISGERLNLGWCWSNILVRVGVR